MMSYLLAIVSTIIGVLDFIAFNGLLRAILAFAIPTDPERAMQSGYMRLTLERVGIILFAMLWLALILFVFYYYNQARDRQRLLIRFAKVTAIELAIAAIGYAVPYLMALL